ncbi:hypothetical protein CO230_03875 [Chryseobacterium sp. 6424]|nr:hypothetical protein CO230_03875 [Chryseobacterium sp. 6424]
MFCLLFCLETKESKVQDWIYLLKFSKGFLKFPELARLWLVSSVEDFSALKQWKFFNGNPSKFFNANNS